MTRLFLLVAVAAVAVVRSSYGLDAPQVQLRDWATYFTSLGEVQNDTKVILGWPRLSVSRGIDMGIVGYGRWDTLETTEVAVDEFSRGAREPSFQVADLSLTFDLSTIWPKSETLLGGVTLQLGKFVFPMFGVGDLVRLNDVMVPHSFTHNPVVGDPSDPTSDERLSQYGVLATWRRKVGEYQLNIDGAYVPVFVPNQYAPAGPWRIIPTGVAVDNDLPAVSRISEGQQFALRVCGSNRAGTELCGMFYDGRDQIPFIVPTSPTSVRLEYPSWQVYGGSLVLPVPFTDTLLSRWEVAYADYSNTGHNYIAALGALESIQTVAGRGLFMLVQGMWRSTSDPTQPLHEVLSRGALARIRYGALFGENGLALQFEGGVNVDPFGFVAMPAVFLPMPSFLDGVWGALGTAPPVLEVRYVWFGGGGDHAFGGLYRNNDHLLVGLTIKR